MAFKLKSEPMMVLYIFKVKRAFNIATIPNAGQITVIAQQKAIAGKPYNEPFNKRENTSLVEALIITKPINPIMTG